MHATKENDAIADAGLRYTDTKFATLQYQKDSDNLLTEQRDTVRTLLKQRDR